MEHTTIAVDLAKSVFQVAVSHRAGRVDAERRLSRDRFLAYFAQQPPATVLLEACGSSHHWARQLEQFGHVVRLLPAHDVHRYVRRNKTDRNDAKALLEAARNEEIHPAPVKTVEHQAITSLHCLRSTWLREINLHWHDLRHEYASRLVERGVPLAQVRDLLGHATIVTTERYDNQRLEMLQAAVARLEDGKDFDAGTDATDKVSRIFQVPTQQSLADSSDHSRKTLRSN